MILYIIFSITVCMNNEHYKIDVEAFSVGSKIFLVKEIWI